MSNKVTNDPSNQHLIEQTGVTYKTVRQNVGNAINREIVLAYWEIGKRIVEFEQDGQFKAEYSKALLVNLSKDLSLRYGKGFSRTNLGYVCLLYNRYPICEAASRKLIWSHYSELLKVEAELARQ